MYLETYNIAQECNCSGDTIGVIVRAKLRPAENAAFNTVGVDLHFFRVLLMALSC